MPFTVLVAPRSQTHQLHIDPFISQNYAKIEVLGVMEVKYLLLFLRWELDAGR